MIDALESARSTQERNITVWERARDNYFAEIAKIAAEPTVITADCISNLVAKIKELETKLEGARSQIETIDWLLEQYMTDAD